MALTASNKMSIMSFLSINCHMCLSVHRIPGVFPESPRWLLLSERVGDMSSFSEHSERQREDDGFTGLFRNVAHHLDSFRGPSAFVK